MRGCRAKESRRWSSLLHEKQPIADIRMWGVDESTCCRTGNFRPLPLKVLQQFENRLAAPTILPLLSSSEQALVSWVRTGLLGCDALARAPPEELEPWLRG